MLAVMPEAETMHLQQMGPEPVVTSVRGRRRAAKATMVRVEMLRALGIRRQGCAVDVRQDEALQCRFRPRPRLRGRGCREEGDTLLGDKGTV